MLDLWVSVTPDHLERGCTHTRSSDPHDSRERWIFTSPFLLLQRGAVSYPQPGRVLHPSFLGCGCLSPSIFAPHQFVPLALHPRCQKPHPVKGAGGPWSWRQCTLSQGVLLSSRKCCLQLLCAVTWPTALRPWTPQTRPLSQTVVQAALPVAIPTSSRGALPSGQLDFSLTIALIHMLIHTFTGTAGCPLSLSLCLFLLALGSRMAPEVHKLMVMSWVGS